MEAGAEDKDQRREWRKGRVRNADRREWDGDCQLCKEEEAMDWTG